MKTMTSKLLIAFTALSLIIFLTTSFTKLDAGNKYLSMRTVETEGGSGPHIVIVYEDGKFEVLKLDRLRDGTMLPNVMKINETINNIINKGYDLVSVSGGDYISNYTFVKK